MRRLEVILVEALAGVVLAGCASTDARWDAGVTRSTDRALAATVASNVAIFMKPEFGSFDLEWEKQPVACHSTTLLRRMGLLEGPGEPPPGRVLVVGEITTEEYPRDEQRSRLKGKEFGRVFGIGRDESSLFEVCPSPRSVEKGIARLRELAAELGADEVRDVFYTGYAEHQMWQGTTISLKPTSPDSPIYTGVQLLDFRLRDVRFHGTAVRRRGP
jgi:hypothetical protein